MSSHADPALVDRRLSRAPFRFEHFVRIFILVAVLSLFYPFTSSAADSPPLFCLPHRRFVLPGIEARFVRSPLPAGTMPRIPVTGTTSFRPLPRH